MKKIHLVNCIICQKSIELSNRDYNRMLKNKNKSTTCSKECRVKFISKLNYTKKEYNCKTCNTIVHRTDGQIKKSKNGNVFVLKVALQSIRIKLVLEENLKEIVFYVVLVFLRV